MTETVLNRNLKIALVAGEKSGDELGGPLMAALKEHNPHIDFIGIGGEQMAKQGLKSLFEMNEISVMGIIEPLLKLKTLLRLRKELKTFLVKEKPDIFVGIDSPDFNLPIAKFLKKTIEIKTVQYVSPSVWAWRKGRIKSMEEFIDSVLTLFPFEEESYLSSSINVSYVGHPLSYKIDLTETDIKNKKANSIALLPGSRKSEIAFIGNLMVKTARELKKDNPAFTFFMPLASKNHLSLFTEDMNDLITISYGDSQEILRKSKLAIITSGTATLESVLSYTPCVTLYRTNWLSYKLIKPLLTIENFSLPNLISGKELLPELLQEELTVENIKDALNSLDRKGLDYYSDDFNKLKKSLMAGGASKASSEILHLLNC
jgi:lipid-A-disaccharide synthase